MSLKEFSNQNHSMICQKHSLLDLVHFWYKWGAFLFTWQLLLYFRNCVGGFSCHQSPLSWGQCWVPSFIYQPSILCSFPHRFIVTSPVGEGQTLLCTELALNWNYIFVFLWHAGIQTSVRRWWSLTGKGWRCHSGYRWYGKNIVHFFPPSPFVAPKLPPFVKMVQPDV